jgi:hypothetical protein
LANTTCPYKNHLFILILFLPLFACKENQT